ncbi:MAG: hypothetical protein KGR26_07495 [Cyanobacteria bacterium REEB65]|nr:hypothetical protein [Cyanobacteria bacterium REEB65]
MSAGVELVWPGKYDAAGQRIRPNRQPPPLRLLESYGSSIEPNAATAAPPNQLILGDNLDAMTALLRAHAGQVDLAYIDPPFATGASFALRQEVGATAEAGEADAPLAVTQAYRDSWKGGLAGYLGMLAPRLELLYELLAPHGSMYIHLDPTASHAVKLLTDEIFGPQCFQREIIWRIGWLSGYKTTARNWIRNHDVLLYYTKDPQHFKFNKTYLPYPPGYLRRDGKEPKGAGIPLEDVWNANAAEFALRGADSLNSIQIQSFSLEKTGYATQKNESLLRRVIAASSDPGDVVADVFCGSGTTLVAASRLGRRWIGCDSGAPAIHMARKRLLALPDPSFELLAGGVEPPTAGTLQVHLERHGAGAAVRLQEYAPGPLPADLLTRSKTFADLIDFWAVDWDHDGAVFRPGFTSFRTRRDRSLELEATSPAVGGEIAVRAVDLAGRQCDVVLRGV